MRVIFMGTPEFAVPSLKKIFNDHELLAVVTQPDRRQGRGKKIQFSPMKKLALNYDVPIYQPKKLSEIFSEIAGLKPDICVVVAFGQKISSEMLKVPKYGFVNVHSSLLPKYRGAAPIQQAILNGDKESGVTTMYLNEKWDAGDIILQKKEPILPDDTGGSLHDRLAQKGAELLSETLNRIENNTAPRIKQDPNKASYAFKIQKTDGLIDWEKSAIEIERLVRAMNPWPGAYTFYREQMIKVWKSTVMPENKKSDHSKYIPGQIMGIDDDVLIVGTGQGILLLNEVQRQNSRRMSGKNLANGLHVRFNKSVFNSTGEDINAKQ